MGGKVRIISVITGEKVPTVIEEYGEDFDFISSILEPNGITVEQIKVYEGDELSTDDGDAWIIGGSGDSVLDNEDWMLDLVEKVRLAVSLGKPIFGICFGHQIIAKALGGEVDVNPNGWELGVHPIQLNEYGKTSLVFEGFSETFDAYESHRDTVIKLPKGAISLAENTKGIQSIQFEKNVFGVQFHPEFSFDIMKKYVDFIQETNSVNNEKITTTELNLNKVLFNFINLVKKGKNYASTII